MSPEKLTPEKLTPQAEEIRARLEEQLLSATTEPDKDGNLKYTNLGLHVLPLLQILGLQEWGFTAWRFSKAKIIKNDTGPVYLIPLRIVSGTPRLEGTSQVEGCLLEPGFKVYMNEMKLQPELDCLFLVPKKMA
ncbi:hypothetical protein MMC14_003089 [Varicellaria rhodocarpa]|nr:hypothetical protein [Varicellaria rhodocarpa]